MTLDAAISSIPFGCGWDLGTTEEGRFDAMVWLHDRNKWPCDRVTGRAQADSPEAAVLAAVADFNALMRRA